MLAYGVGLGKTYVVRRIQAFACHSISPHHIAKIRSGDTRPRASSSSSSSSYSSGAPLRTRGNREWKVLALIGEVAWVLCVAHCFVEYVAEPYTVAGISMEPTITNMSVVAINKAVPTSPLLRLREGLDKAFPDPRGISLLQCYDRVVTEEIEWENPSSWQGDDEIIVCTCNVRRSQMRGRSAPLKVGEIVVAQTPPEPGRMVLKRVLGVAGDYIKVRPPPWDVSNTLNIEKRLEVVPEGHVWLEGDNKDNSTDSRSYGAVPQALVEGVVFVRLWPLRDVGLM